MKVIDIRGYAKGGRFDGTSGGGDDGGMEARVAKLEAALSHVERDVGEVRSDLKEVRRDITSIRTTDFRLLFGAIIAVALGLAGMMTKGFHWP
jgi:hypothetical protein